MLKRNFLSHRLAIPSIALEEAASHLERRAIGLLERISESGYTPRLEAQYQRLFFKEKRTRETAGELAQRYKKFIRIALDKNQGVLVEPPNVELDTLLERSIDRKKPFNKGDKGFRDTLIWLNAVDLVREFKRVSFVSANTSDYSDGSDLHPDLKEDLTEVLPDHLSFRYFRGLPEFIAFMDRDGSAGATALRNALMSTGYAGFTLDNWVLKEGIGSIEELEFDGVEWTAFPYWAENPKLTELEDLVGIEVHGEQSIGDDRIEFYCDVSLVGVFQCSILLSSWESIIHPMQVEWVDEESSDIWTAVGVRSAGTFIFRIIFDLNTASIVESNVVVVPHKIMDSQEDLEDIRDEEREYKKNKDIL